MGGIFSIHLLNQKNKIMLIKLTEKRFAEYGKNEFKVKTILLGTESIIKIEPYVITSGSHELKCTKILSVGAMVETSYVTETIEEIEEMVKSRKK